MREWSCVFGLVWLFSFPKENMVTQAYKFIVVHAEYIFCYFVGARFDHTCRR